MAWRTEELVESYQGNQEVLHFKIKCARNKTELYIPKLLILTIKYRTVNCIKMEYLMY